MYEPYGSQFTYLAPGASGYASPMVLPGANQTRFPPVDEHVVEPETRQEMIDGRIVQASPAHPPHGDRHSELDYVLRASVAPHYVTSTDMLTRTSEKWNFAADASIRKEGEDPATGRRYLEELAFEIKYTQSMKDITARARQLANRGVRRVFMICVRAKEPGDHDKPGPAGPVMEWSAAEDRWIELAPDALIEDPCLHSPIPVRALLDAVEAKKAVAQALLAEDNPVLTEAIEAAKAQTLREAIVDMCDLLAIELTPERRAHIEALDPEGLRALRVHLKTHRRCPDGCPDGW